MASNSEVLDVCFAFLDLRTIARACVASKACMALAHITLRQHACKLLPQAVTACCSRHVPGQWQQQQKAEAGVLWVLKHTSKEALPGLSAHLVAIPHLPSACCKLLVAAGARSSWEQLVAAARSRVAGVEVWVQVQLELGHASNLPAIAAAICEPRPLVSKIQQELGRIRPQELGDILHIAVNARFGDGLGVYLLHMLSNAMPMPQVPAAQHQRLQAALAALPAAEVDSLLATALQRCYCGLVPCLERLPQQRLLPAASIAQWFREAELFFDPGYSLLRSKSFQQLDPAEVLAVLEAAVEQLAKQHRQQYGHRHTGAWIQSFAGAHRTAAVDPGRLAGLIQATLQLGGLDAMKGLCNMEAAQQIDATEVAGMFDAEMQQQQPRLAHVQHLLGLLAAHQQADKRHILAFSTAAVQQKDSHALEYICGLPAAQQQLNTAEAGHLLKDVMTNWHQETSEPHRSCRQYIYRCLARLPAIQQFQPSAVSSHLVLAMQQQLAAAVKMLCELPGVQQLDAQQLSEVLQAAAVQGYLHSQTHLKLPAVEEAARQLSAEDMELLVQQVLEGNTSSGLKTFKWLMALENAQQLGATAIMRLIICSTQYQQSSEPVEWLCEHPAAQQLPASAVLQLLRFAITQYHQHQQQQPKPRCLSRIVGWLALLPGAQQLNVAAVQQLLVLAVKQGAVGVLKQIVQQLSVAHDIDAAAVQQLKQVAEEWGVSKSCQLFIKHTWKHVK